MTGRKERHPYANSQPGGEGSAMKGGDDFSGLLPVVHRRVSRSAWSAFRCAGLAAARAAFR